MHVVTGFPSFGWLLVLLGAGLFVLLASLPGPREFGLGIDQRKPARGFQPGPVSVCRLELLDEREGLLIYLLLCLDGGYPGISCFQQFSTLRIEARQEPVVLRGVFIVLGGNRVIRLL